MPRIKWFVYVSANELHFSIIAPESRLSAIQANKSFVVVGQPMLKKDAHTLSMRIRRGTVTVSPGGQFHTPSEGLT